MMEVTKHTQMILGKNLAQENSRHMEKIGMVQRQNRSSLLLVCVHWLCIAQATSQGHEYMSVVS